MGIKRLAKECVYCGSKSQLTRDHVPGRGLFSDPLPSNLITVPCCLKCNGEHEREDEYFRLHVASRQESRGHPEATQAGERAFSRLEHPESSGFRRYVLNSIVSLERVSAAPDSEGMLGVFMVDFSRLNRYAERTLKALFAYHWRVRVPEDYKAVALCADMHSFSQQEMHERLARMLSVVENAKQYSSARQILQYKFAPFMTDGISSIWALSFFSHTAFIGAVVPGGAGA